MRIALDATPLTVPSGGIARYTAELSAALAAAFPEDEYWLVSDQPWKNGPSAPNLRAGRPPYNWITRRWWLAGLPLELRRRRIEVFHGTNFEVPPLPLFPAVMTFHDCSPWREGAARAAGAARVRRRTPLLVRIATMVITHTESVRREAIEKFRLTPSRVAAVPLAAGPQFYPRPGTEVAATLARLGLSVPYILFVGTRDPRKNVAALVAAWREARRVYPELKLVIAGRPGEDSPAAQVLNSTRERGLAIVGKLTDAEIAALLSGAVALVYPSLYEGFGLPVLEAMQTGAPVVISRDPALQEVAGGAAVTADTEFNTSLARAIVELMRDPQWRLHLRENGIRRAAQFSWRHTAIRTREVYVEAQQRF